MAKVYFYKSHFSYCVKAFFSLTILMTIEYGAERGQGLESEGML